jgi:hypothetical protein
MFASSVLSNLCSNYQAHTKTKEKPFAWELWNSWKIYQNNSHMK